MKSIELRTCVPGEGGHIGYNVPRLGTGDVINFVHRNSTVSREVKSVLSFDPSKRDDWVEFVLEKDRLSRIVPFGLALKLGLPNPETQGEDLIKFLLQKIQWKAADTIYMIHVPHPNDFENSKL